MNKLDIRDWFVMILAGLLWGIATFFLFRHPTEANFATWATLSGTMLGAYHWMVIRDQKVPDACASQ
ncbi:MAG TPA: hypothetical protein VN734_17075 [Acidobacteriaceae bacterium]|nr:hypothetical protein [Acidobacteriaceae bacterium]